MTSEAEEFEEDVNGLKDDLAELEMLAARLRRAEFAATVWCLLACLCLCFLVGLWDTPRYGMWFAVGAGGLLGVCVGNHLRCSAFAKSALEELRA